MFAVLNKFSCERSGGCCTNIKRNLDEGEQRILFRASEGEEIGLPLFEWEAAVLKKEAEKNSMDIKIKPLQFFYDRRSKKAVIVTWHLDHASCPFYGDHRCNVYERRPSVCRMFPVLNSNILNPGGQLELPKTVCPNDNGRNFVSGGDFRGYVKSMLSYYGSAFVEGVQRDMVNLYLVNMIKDMKDKGVIDPIVAPRELALRRFEQSEKISMFEFLISIGLDTPQGAGNKVARFTSLADANEKIRAIVG